MSRLSAREQGGCRKLLLDFLTAEDVLTLKDTVTSRLVEVESTREAVEAIISYSQDAEELLKRKKVQRDAIFKYLVGEGVVVPPQSEKSQLIRKTLQLWSEQGVAGAAPDDGQLDVAALGRQFCQWFFGLLNGQNPAQRRSGEEWGPQHFWGDARLRLLLRSGEEEFRGSALVCRRLCALAEEERLLFCPNVEGRGLRCVMSPHGLVLVGVAGTVHRDSACLGVFEQVFGLIRSPTDDNRWKIKLVDIKVERGVSSGEAPAITCDLSQMMTLYGGGVPH